MNPKIIQLILVIIIISEGEINQEKKKVISREK